MSRIAPFVFDRSFEAAAEAVDPAAAAMAEALAAAEARGFAAGEAAALDRCRAERETALLAAVETLVGELDRCDDALAEATAFLEQQGIELARAAAELLAGHAIAAEPLGAIEATLGRLLEELRRGLPLGLWVHPDLVAPLAQRVAERQAGERRQRPVSVQPDPSLAPGDARFAWDQGAALVEAAARRDALARTLAELGRHA